VYDRDATCPTWERFLATIFPATSDAAEEAGDAELITFVQRLLGLCLTGDVREHLLPVLWGTGANGKSTLVNVLLEMLGRDYSMKAPPNLLMARRGESHPTERADLFGRRLVVCSETPEGRRLNEALVKDMMGGEPIRARRMREDFWEFVPTHKVLLCTNHRPIILGTDEGIWRRLRLIPFEVTFWDPNDPSIKGRYRPAHLKQDKELPGKLRLELPGILAWCVRGCLDWQRDGLTLPERVRVATAEYRSGEDVLGQFIIECCLVGKDPAYRVKASDLYTRYRAWCEAGGERPSSPRILGASMTERGFERLVSNGTWYLGIALRDSDPQENE
jgi:putative DNA primase/helicase